MSADVYQLDDARAARQAKRAAAWALGSLLLLALWHYAMPKA